MTSSSAWTVPQAGPQHAEQLNKRLPWLTVALNTWCAQAGSGIVFPLAGGHVSGTHVMVDYTWTESEKQSFDGITPPRQIFHHDLAERRCIVLRFTNVQSDLADSDWPIALSQEDWVKPGPYNFIYIGSMQSAEAMAKPDPTANKFYWIFPSEFLSQMSQGRREQNSDKPAQFWRRVDLQTDVLPEPKFTTASMPVLSGSDFLSEEAKAAGVNPGACVMGSHNGDLYNKLREILQGDDGVVKIGSTQSPDMQYPIDSASYHLALREINQATWDYGCEFTSDRPSMTWQEY